MRPAHLVLVAALALPAFAQQYRGSGMLQDPSAAGAAPVMVMPEPPHFTDLLANLSSQPAVHNGYTFDRNALQVAQGVLEAEGMDAKRATLALRGISFDNYRYKQPAFYTPEAMAALIDSYKAAGWKHLVNANQTPANSAQPGKPITDVWLHFSGADIDAVTVLNRGPKMMNVVQVACDLRPLDLLHLGGHFGIPRVDPSAVMVPAP